MKIGERLKYERNKINLTQADVATNLSVARQTISAWENERSYPDIQSLVALSDLYSISLDILLREDELIMEHLETDNRIFKKSQLISKISYFANIALLLIVILSELLQLPLIINDSAHLLFYTNIVVFLIFKQILQTEEFNRQIVYKLLAVILIALIALSIFAIVDAPRTISPYDLGSHVGYFVLLLTKVLSVLLIFSPIKRRN